VTLLSNATITADKITDVLKMVLSLYGFQAVEDVEHPTIRVYIKIKEI
jgi:hypothetical protein